MYMKKFLKNSSFKPHVWIWNNLTGMFLGWPFLKKVREILIRRKTWPPWWGRLALYGHEEILKKSSFPKPLVRIWNYFTRLFLKWPFSKVFSKFWSVEKHGHHGGGGEDKDMKTFFKNLLWNPWFDFEIISQECSLGDPIQKLCVILIRQETWPPCGGDMDMKKFLKHSSSLKPHVWFWNNFTGMFPWWPFSKNVREILICRKTWLRGWGGRERDFALYGQEEILKKSFSLKMQVRMWNISQDCF